MRPIDAHVHLGNFPFGNITERVNVFGGIRFSHKALHSLIMSGTSGHRLDVKKFLSENRLGGCVLVPLSKNDENFIRNIKMKNVFRLRFFDYQTRKCDPDVFDGYKIHPVIERLDVNSEAYAGFFRNAERKKVPLVIHSGFYPLGHYAEFGAIEKLKRLLDNYKLRIVVCHGGGEHWKKLISMLDNYDFYVDLSLCSQQATEKLCTSIGAEKLIFGSDYPLGNPQRRMNIISKFAGGQALEKILYKNSLKLFG